MSAGELVGIGAAFFSLLAVTPAFFRHPHENFLGIRLTVGITVLAGAVSTLIFALNHNQRGFFVGLGLTATLGLLGVRYIEQQQEAFRALTRRERRRLRRRLLPLSGLATAWVGALGAVVAMALEAIG